MRISLPALMVALLAATTSVAEPDGAFRLEFASSSCTHQSEGSRVFQAGREGWRSPLLTETNLRGGRLGTVEGASLLQHSFEEIETLRALLLAATDCTALRGPAPNEAWLLETGRDVSELRAREAQRLVDGRALLESVGVTPESVAAARQRILMAASKDEAVPESSETLERQLSYQAIAQRALDQLAPRRAMAVFGSSTVTAHFPGPEHLTATASSVHPLVVTVDGVGKQVCDPRLAARVRRLWSTKAEVPDWPGVFFDGRRTDFREIREELSWLEARRRWRSSPAWAVLAEHFDLISARVMGPPDDRSLRGRFRVRQEALVDEVWLDVPGSGTESRPESLLGRWREVEEVLGSHAWLGTWKRHWPDAVVTLDDRTVDVAWLRQLLGAWATADLPGEAAGRLVLTTGSPHVRNAHVLFGRPGDPLLLAERNHGVLNEHWFDALSANTRQPRLVTIGSQGQVTRIGP